MLEFLNEILLKYPVTDNKKNEKEEYKFKDTDIYVDPISLKQLEEKSPSFKAFENFEISKSEKIFFEFIREEKEKTLICLNMLYDNIATYEKTFNKQKKDIKSIIHLLRTLIERDFNLKFYCYDNKERDKDTLKEYANNSINFIKEIFLKFKAQEKEIDNIGRVKEYENIKKSFKNFEKNIKKALENKEIKEQPRTRIFLNNIIKKELINSNYGEVKEFYINREKNIKGSYILTIDNDMQEKIENLKISYFDLVMIDTISTIYKNSKDIEDKLISNFFIHNVLNNSNIKKEMILQHKDLTYISNSIDKLVSTKIKIEDKTNKDKEYFFKEHLLEIKSFGFKEYDKNFTIYYRLLSKPILLSYAESKNQILEIDRKFFDLKSSHETQISINHYLATTINNKMLGEIISFDTLLKKTTDYIPVKRYKTTRLKNFCLERLAFFKKNKLIKDYKEIGKGKELNFIIKRNI